LVKLFIFKIFKDEISLFESLITWGNHQIKNTSKTLKEVLKEPMKYIRCGLIDPNDLIDIVKPSNLIEPEQYLIGLEYNASPTLIAELEKNNISFKPRGSLTNFKWVTTNNNFSFKDNNLTCTKIGASSWTNCYVYGTQKFSSGVHYFEIKINAQQGGGAGTYIGITSNPTSTYYSSDIVVGMNNAKYNILGSNFTAGINDKVGIKLDFPNSKAKFYKNGSDTGAYGNLIPNTTYYAIAHLYYINDSVSISIPNKTPK
jgi:hypothetical protein